MVTETRWYRAEKKSSVRILLKVSILPEYDALTTYRLKIFSPSIRAHVLYTRIYTRFPPKLGHTRKRRKAAAV